MLGSPAATTTLYARLYQMSAGAPRARSPARGRRWTRRAGTVCGVEGGVLLIQKP